jgi:predicted RNase H-like nuclease (RuvC/YqgF family)
MSLSPIHLGLQQNRANEQIQLSKQEEYTLDILNQTLAIIENQNSAIQAEYTTTLQQAEHTLAELQQTQQQLLQQNSILATQNSVLQNQHNQSEKVHQADQKAVQERIDILEKALREKSNEVSTLQKTVALHEKGLTDIESIMWTLQVGQINPAACRYRVKNTIQEIKKQIANLSQGK